MRSLVAIAAWLFLAMPVLGVELSRQIDFNVAAQPLASAIVEFSKQAQIQVLGDGQRLDGIASKGVRGRYAIGDALRTLLEGTGFGFKVAGSTTISLTTTTSTTDREIYKAESLMVTAQRREQRLQEVPISISVMRGEDLDRSTTQGVREELSRVPGVVISDNFAGIAQVTVRGVSNPGGPLGTGASTAAYYLESVPFSFVKSAILPDAGAYDLDRVEVLRGPQGTLYGASALNGVVRILTRDANPNEFEFKARGLVSSTEDGSESYRGDLAINVPIVEGKLAARAVMSYQDLGGWIDKPAINKPDANEAKVRTLRLKVNAQPSEQLSIGAFAWYSRDRFANPSASADARQRLAPISEPVTNDFDTYGLKIAYESAAFFVTSVTGYIDYINSADFFSAIALPATQSFKARTFAQEVTLNSRGKGNWRWTAGGMYRDSKDWAETRIASPAFPLPAKVQQLSESYAVFGELTRAFLGGDVELTGGLRYFEDNVGLREISRLGPQPQQYVSNDAKFDTTTTRAVVTWHPTRQMSAYASYGEGFRSGVLQTPTIVVAGIPPAKPDRLKNYEIGAKGSLFRGRLSYDTALYYIKWEDIQRNLLVQSPSGLFFNAIVNGTSASGPGVDLAASLSPIQGLTLSVNASWNDLRMDSDVLTGGVGLFRRGDRIDAAQTTLGASADYEFAIGAAGLRGRISASANYTSATDSRFVAGGVLTVNRGESKTIARASFSVTTSKGWTVIAFVDNLNNWQARTVPYSVPDDFAFRVRPRTFGMQFEYQM